MGRKRRIHIPGAVYHIIQRGNNKEYIFQDEMDKRYIASLLKEHKEGYQYRVLGFVLMSNHYHIMMQPLEAQLSDIFQRINLNYSKYYNAKYNRSGHVFQGRYTAILVHDQGYLLGLLRYIHQNPIKANMVNKVGAYQWSSDIFYRTNIRNKLVDIDTILDMFNSKRREAIIQYRAFMDQDFLEEADIYEYAQVIGEENILIKPKVQVRKSLDLLLKETGASDEEYKLIMASSRKRSLTPLKLSYIAAAREVNYTFKEIGEFINISQGSAHEMYTRYSGYPVNNTPAHT